MTPAGGWIRFKRQIGILHARFDLAVEGCAEEIGETEFRTPHTPFVIEGCFVSGDDAAAAV